MFKYFECPAILLAILIGASSLQVQASCNNAMAATAPDERYIDNQDGTVTDTSTSLMWKQCTEGLTGTACSEGSAPTYTWGEALKLAVAVNNNGGFAGHTDWRLPNINELVSLVEFQCTAPAINETFFPGTLLSTYWSSSPTGRPDGTVSTISFNLGTMGFTLTDQSGKSVVRLVRGGP